MKKIHLIILGMLVIVVASIGFAVVKSNNTNQKKSDKLTIVASTNVYGEVAKTVAGSHADVQAIITKQNVSPEDYEPTRSVANQVSQADIALANGLGYDSWLNKLARTSKKTELIRVGEDIVHKKSGDNPHLWNDPQTMIDTAKYLADVLSKKDPKHKDDYQANAQKYIDSLKPVTDLVNELKEQAPSQKVAQTEPVFGYMLEALGYHITDEDFAEAVEEGNDPSPAVLTSLQNNIKTHQIGFLVDNTQTSSSTVDNIVKLAKENQVPIVKVTETSPTDQTYVQWKLSELKQIQDIVKK
ncbi:metal ABC transporter solute-binding protein, Zn/Mn family [Convivina intestini]|uniref:Zinc/manganese transport system substrate-binding protein n=1 Tax=Convivina intestini TaxID=1505726 RepID=A0A2U1D9P1_9LACO|nr:zinc ABC transporter substrate-binding protein [Convivina intestini]PVY84358.1 zinc/manganese transport system substrate-binding protein [Convivina intestini]CAH1857102.1 hypothetical protein R077811_01402 [Convivina intestini]SDC07041.1 zinc/manganese transport system substrate-binding protein [Leuconostocaceae bacterium R-53105]